MSTRHRAEVTEVYPDIGQCAVKFKHNGKERVECVKMIGVYTVGLTGMVDYRITSRTGLWSFEPKLTDTDRANRRVLGAKQGDIL
jgi:hypothetical protein